MNNFSWLCVKLELQHNVIPAKFTDSLLILKYKGKFPAFAPLRFSATYVRTCLPTFQEAYQSNLQGSSRLPTYAA
jgi:hypothetical protein